VFVFVLIFFPFFFAGASGKREKCKPFTLLCNPS
jgi:hypothetical protein